MSAAPRIAFRCDGDENTGAGHVARCLPLAAALEARGCEPVFVGRYGGLAAWLLDRAGARTAAPLAEPPETGLEPDQWSAAVVDSYAVSAAQLCGLADRLELATMGEANRCEDAGVLIDYHVDRAGDEDSDRLLAGPAYAPVDPAFASARRPRSAVASILVTVGGTARARQSLEPLLSALARHFPDATVMLAGGAREGIRGLPVPSVLHEHVAQADLAVSAAGFTAYELACAGVPMLLIALAGNQQRVLAGCLDHGLAVGIDARAGIDEHALDTELERLRDPGLRNAMSRRSMELFDGLGAERSAAALMARWQVGTAAPQR